MPKSSTTNRKEEQTKLGAVRQRYFGGSIWTKEGGEGRAREQELPTSAHAPQ